MKIICFKGVNDSGKSKTIKRILNNFFKIKIIPLTRKDVSIIFTWNNKRVLICSFGDSEREIEKSLLIPLKTEKCDIIICACHPNNSAYKLLVKEFEEKNIDFIDCPRGESEEEYNRRISEFKEFVSV